MEIWEELGRTGPECAVVGGVEIRRGSRVRLHPRTGRDPWDALFAGRTAVVERIEEDTDGALHVVVELAEDPARQKLFFGVDEVEPLLGTRVLVAGIGNVFLGDDGFGCAVARALADVPLPDGVEVQDFGIRGMDLAYALAGYDVAVLVDAMPLGDAPGTIAVIEPEADLGDADIETHAMDPVRVLRLARELGALPGRVLVVGCQPEEVDERMELSAPMQAAVARAVGVVVELVKGGDR